MSRGTEWPLRMTSRGGLAQSDDNLRTIEALSLLPSTSTNAFDERDGLNAPDFVWEAFDGATAALARGHVQNVYRRLEAQGRARLESVQVLSGGADGRVAIAIRRTNLETGESDVVTSEVGG